MVRYLTLILLALSLIQCGGGRGAPDAFVEEGGNNPPPSTDHLEGEAFNGPVLAIEKNAVTGLILVGGDFTAHNQVTGINRLVQLIGDGRQETAFINNLGAGFNDKVRVVKTLSNGKILVGGDFTDFDGNAVGRLVQLNSDGSYDSSFTTQLGTGFNASVNSINEAPNGDILVTGKFSQVSSVVRRRFARLSNAGLDITP